MHSRSWQAKLLTVAVPLALAVGPATARAANGVDDDSAPPDARLEGFSNAAPNTPAGPLLVNPQSGNAGTWFLLALAGVVCFGVMAKNARRTHLD